MPVRTSDTRTWLFLPGADLWEDETPTKKDATWAEYLLPLLISVISLFLSPLLSDFYKLLLFVCFFALSLSLYLLHTGEHCCMAWLRWKCGAHNTDTNWGPTKKKLSACAGWLNVQKRIKTLSHKKNWSCISAALTKKSLWFCNVHWNLCRFEILCHMK